MTQALDAGATGSSAIAVGCAVSGLAPCAAVASIASTTFSTVGVSWTALNVISGRAEPIDGAIAVTTLRMGAQHGLRANGYVGLGVSIFQWLWDNR